MGPDPALVVFFPLSFSLIPFRPSPFILRRIYLSIYLTHGGDRAQTRLSRKIVLSVYPHCSQSLRYPLAYYTTYFFFFVSVWKTANWVFFGFGFGFAFCSFLLFVFVLYWKSVK